MFITAFWGPRHEGFSPCAEKLAGLLPAVNAAVGADGTWFGDQGAPVGLALKTLKKHMDQEESEVTDDAMEDMGWWAHFHRGGTDA